MKEKMTMVTDQYGMGKDLVFEQEAAQPEPQPEVEAAPVVEQEAAPVEEVHQEPEQPIRQTKNAPNFRTLKAEAAKTAKERDELKALVEQYQQQMRQQSSHQFQPTPSHDDLEVDNDAYVEGKHVKTLYKELKELKNELKQSRSQTQGMAVKAALVSEHPDFERVVTPENLKALEITYPHLARAINVNDPYVAGKACYDLIKQFGIDQDDAQDSEITKAVIAQNAAKPKPAAAVKGTRPTNETTMGRASEFYNGELNDQMKKQFYRELQDAMKGYGGYKP